MLLPSKSFSFLLIQTLQSSKLNGDRGEDSVTVKETAGRGEMCSHRHSGVLSPTPVRAAPPHIPVLLLGMQPVTRDNEAPAERPSLDTAHALSRYPIWVAGSKHWASPTALLGSFEGK